MTETYSYSTTFTLSKAYLSECYEQSVVQDPSMMKYKRAAVWLVIGIGLQVSALVSEYIAYFVISLGALEVFSTRYHKTWWLWRQMLGKSYKSKVTVLINDAGINTCSQYVNERVEWQDITEIEKTTQGLIIRYAKRTSYLSNSYLDDVALEYIAQQIKIKA